MKQIYLKSFLLCLFALAGTKAMAYDCYVDGIYYNLYDNGTAEVTYKTNVTMRESSSRITIFFNADAYINNVSIPNQVVYNGMTYSVLKIGKEAFKGCEDLTSVIIPSSILSIEEEAFSWCSNLTSVTIPSSVTSIGKYAFSGCGNLSVVFLNSEEIVAMSYLYLLFGNQVTEYIIGESVKKIGNYAFARCSNLTSMTIGSNVTSIGEGAFSNCENMTSINIPEKVTNIEKWAFAECYKLTKVTLNSDSIVSKKRTSSESLESIFGRQVTNYVIGDNVKEIGDYAFYGCSSLNEIAIGKSVTSIGDRAFYNCSGLTSITFPNSLTSFGYDVFSGCNNLGTLVLPDNLTRSGSYFPSFTKLYVSRGTISLLFLWKLGYKPYDKIKESLLLPPTIKYSSTQTTVKVWVDNIYDEYDYQFEDNYNSMNGNEVVFNNLFPENTYTIYMYVRDKERKGYYYTDLNIYTKSISPSVKIDGTTASSIKAVGFYEKGDVNVVSENISLNGVQMSGHEISITGLDPVKDYLATYNITVSNGLTTKKYTGNSYLRTNTLSITTSQPKVVSPGNVIVAATTNLDEEETNVGFEWRRTDWTNDFSSNTGSAALYEGTMEGYIRNLYTEKLWKYRPYYLSNSGTYYYGDWVGIDPTNTSYFEPTVHTYAKIEIEGNTALVKGYALRGTDNVNVQGFMYWKDANQAKAALASRKATEIPDDAMTVKATGQTMTATLKNLDYESTYSYVAFVTTSEGETFYGDVRSFSTGTDPTGIENVEVSTKEPATEVARYNMNGHRITSPQRGINIVRMSDGTVQKVMVK